MRRKVAYLHGNLPIPISHNVSSLCVKCPFKDKYKNKNWCCLLMLSGPQVLCVLILCRSFCTPGRDIAWGAVFRVWVLVHSGMLSCGSTVNTD